MIRKRLILRFLGVLLLMIGISMVPAWMMAFYWVSAAQSSFLYSIVLVMLLGSASMLLPSVRGQEIGHREAFLIVSLGWLIAAAAAALPYWFYGMLAPQGAKYFPDFTAAYFESMSGLTTTGSTILPSIEDLPKSLLLWRSLTHWLGGMGIILLGIAILPFLGIGGMQLYRAEVPGPTADKLSPRIAETAKSLWIIYIMLTAVETLFLMFGGMSLFDAVCHSFATVATGGFSTRNISVEAYRSVYIEVVITVFMALAGMNFALHFFALRGELKKVWKNEEFRFYAFVIALWSVMIAWSLQAKGAYKSFWEGLRYSSFQVVSLLTSTGFSSCDFDVWRKHSSFAVFWVVLLMFIGGCAGSTGGGIKCVRIWLLMKAAYRELVRLIHPRMVKPVKIDGRAVPEEVLSSVAGFFALFLFVMGVSTLALTWYGMNLLSAFTAVAACIGNIGPGFDAVGPYQNFGFMPIGAKWILIFCMLLGRLELYTVLILFVPQFWRK
ncbi:MAG: TrkH family potassium uptake protein [Myxococcales bacterium]|nr:TrkH family potassium uptake protein [Myxococcales bacterium]